MGCLKLISLISGANGCGISTAVGSHLNLTNANGQSFHIFILLNCGDCVQRCCMDNAIKLNKLKIILISSLCPHNISGLPGLLLYLSGIGLDSTILIGPPGIKQFVEACKLFVNKK